MNLVLASLGTQLSCDFPVSASQALRFTPWGFYMGAGGLNHGPHTCTVSALSCRSSP